MGLKLLFIDDDEDSLEFSDKFFSKRNYQVLTANNGAEGINIINEEEPDLVILDLKMDDVDGINVLKKIRASGNKTKVMVVSAMDDPQIINDVKKLGVSGYISKPTDLYKLEESISFIFKQA